MTAPTWLELVVRMCAGESAEPPFVGVLEVADDEDDRWPSRVRVFKDRDRYRVETIDGKVLTIRNREHAFVFDAGDVPHRYDLDPDDEFRPGTYADLLERSDVGRWKGDDFGTPTGPARRVTFLGRDAWQIELAPPEHKPSPLVITIDAEHGMTYEARSVHFGVLHRWTELELKAVASLDEALFAWHGDATYYVVGSHEVTEEEAEQEQREREYWMADRGVGPLSITSTVRLFPHEQETSGGFFASFDVNAHGFVARRPRSDEPWDLDVNYPDLHRWSDSTWDWCVGGEDGPRQLAEIRRQLAEPREPTV